MKVKLDEFIKKDEELAKKADELVNGHPKEVKGVRAHLPGQKEFKNKCPHCMRMTKAMQELIDFEKENLGVTRIDSPSLTNTIKIMRQIVKRMRKDGEI